MNPQFTFVTYSQLPHLDPDDRLTLIELEKRGIRSQVAVWDDPSVDWANAGTCIVRSTWDYHLKYPQFLSWIANVSEVASIWNQPSLLQWNSNKRYLQDLQDASIPVVPTVFLEQGIAIELSAIASEQNWTKVVIKPAIGLSTYGVKVITVDDAFGQNHLDSLLENGPALVQPFLDSVSQVGERALVFLGSSYSHTVRKAPFQVLAPIGHAGESLVTPSAADLSLAQKVLGTLTDTPIYARVDIVSDAAGQERILELELVEPSLYLSMYPPAVTNFADVLCSFC